MVERRGVEGLADDLADHRAMIADHCPTYGSALTVLRTIVDGPLADQAIVTHLDRCWRERFFRSFYERPLLLLASLRHEAIVEGKRNPLYTAFATEPADPDAVTRNRMIAALSPDRLSIWLAIATRRVQTNEVSRAVVWRWPAQIIGADGGARPLAIVDVGCSAGLNLVADRLPADWTDGAGRALAVARALDLRARIGFDTQPLDVRFDDDATWLRACIWPGQPDRMARFEEAVAAMRAAYAENANAPTIYALHAGLVPNRLEALARKLDSNVTVIAYQSLVRDYLEPERLEQYTRGMRAWLAGRPAGRAMWVELEMNGDPRRDRPAQITAHVHAGGGEVRSLTLAACGYHPRAIEVNDAAVAELRRVSSM